MQAEASFLNRAVTLSTYAVLARVSPGYPPLLGRLPTCYSPVRRSPVAEATFARDLHVLSTPPAFILSQDQTLQFGSISAKGPAKEPLTVRVSFGIRSPRDARRKEVLVVETLPLFSFQRTGAPLEPIRANPDTTATFGQSQHPTECRSKSPLLGHAPPIPVGLVMRLPFERTYRYRQGRRLRLPGTPRASFARSPTGRETVLIPAARAASGRVDGVNVAPRFSKISRLSATTSRVSQPGGEI